MNRRWTFALALSALAALAAARWAVGSRLEPAVVLAFLRNAKDEPWAIFSYGFIYFASTAMLLPAIAMHVAAGVVWGFSSGWVIACVAANAASNAQFAVGRWLGPERVKAWLLRRGWGRLVDELEQRGAVTMMIVRQLPLPFVAVNVTAGASPMAWSQFVVGNAVGLLPSVTTYTYFAAAIADGVEGAREQAFGRAVAAAVAAIVVGVVSRWALSRRAKKHSAT